MGEIAHVWEYLYNDGRKPHWSDVNWSAYDIYYEGNDPDIVADPEKYNNFFDKALNAGVQH